MGIFRIRTIIASGTAGKLLGGALKKEVIDNGRTKQDDIDRKAYQRP